MRDSPRQSRICERFNAKSAIGGTDFELICYKQKHEKYGLHKISHLSPKPLHQNPMIYYYVIITACILLPAEKPQVCFWIGG